MSYLDIDGIVDIGTTPSPTFSNSPATPFDSSNIQQVWLVYPNHTAQFMFDFIL